MCLANPLGKNIKNIKNKEVALLDIITGVGLDQECPTWGATGCVDWPVDTFKLCTHKNNTVIVNIFKLCTHIEK
jgi:hypothetical protein